MTGAEPAARQGEVWFTDLDPTRGREQAGRRPVLVLSVDQIGTGTSRLFIGAPLTTRDHRVRLHLAVESPEGGLRAPSYLMPEQIRCLSRGRLIERWGRVSDGVLLEAIRRARLMIRPPL
ncbi:MAG: type II toxin-antitoxin system PemK/MazF family toxin [Actinomycetota bacterium]|nr:type II toxin-antitoxin system PemK/MazF family toxin [Actinomycetota bacterium]